MFTIATKKEKNSVHKKNFSWTWIFWLWFSRKILSFAKIDNLKQFLSFAEVGCFWFRGYLNQKLKIVSIENISSEHVQPHIYSQLLSGHFILVFLFFNLKLYRYIIYINNFCKCSNPNIFATWWCKSLVFQPKISWLNRIYIIWNI